MQEFLHCVKAQHSIKNACQCSIFRLLHGASDHTVLYLYSVRESKRKSTHGLLQIIPYGFVCTIQKRRRHPLSTTVQKREIKPLTIN